MTAYKGGEKTIMGNSYVLVHYAQGSFNYLPYALDLCVGVFRKKQPDFIALYSMDLGAYIRKWTRSGIGLVREGNHAFPTGGGTRRLSRFEGDHTL